MPSSDRLIRLVLLATLAATLSAFAWMSEKRYFDYDEFQVLYASNAMLRGKALYADEVGTHFPLANFLVAAVVDASGPTVSALVNARRAVLVLSVLSLWLVYRIGAELRSREVGLVAATLTATCTVFFDKALEIRHDTFSTAFLVTAVYLFVRFHGSKRILWLCLSGASAGLALASTQKAVVSLAGIGLGIAAASFCGVPRREALRVCLTFAACLLLSLSGVLSLLVAVGSETPASILEHAILGPVGYLAPTSAAGELAFGESKLSIWRRLVSTNPLLYPLGIGALLFFVVRDFRRYRVEHVVVFWGVVGVAFYLYMKRPFFQSLLPAIPALALSIALLLDRSRWPRLGGGARGRVAFCLVLFCLLAWPANMIGWQVVHTARAARVPVQPFTRSLSNQNELASLRFCVDHARADEPVICFTQQQIFFEPLLSYRENECGASVRSIDRDCLLEGIRRSQSRILIWDYRTRALPQEARDALLDHFQRRGIGDVYVPGFVLEPLASAEREILVSGTYRIGADGERFGAQRGVPESIELDGRVVKKPEMFLESGVHRFRNRTKQRVRILYRFPGEA